MQSCKVCKSCKQPHKSQRFPGQVSKPLDSISIAAGGDCLCRTYNTPEQDDPFIGVHHLFASADIGFINLEAVLTERTKPAIQKLVTVRTNPSCAQYLPAHGINMVNLANNHILDYGAEGALETRGVLTDLGVLATGISDDRHFRVWRMGSYIEAAGMSVCSIGLHEYPLRDRAISVNACEGRYDEVYREIEHDAQLHDIVIVSVHAGIEHAIRPYHVHNAAMQGFIDAGARIVLGHHPHVVQCVERYKNGLIAHSLGCLNFTMLGYVKDRWYHKLSYVLRVTVNRDRVLDWDQVPIWIDEYGRPSVIVDRDQVNWARDYFNYLNRRGYEYPDPRTQLGSDWDEEAGWEYFPLVAWSFVRTIAKFGMPRVRKLAWWLKQPLTRQAMKGLAKSVAKGRTRSFYKPKPPKEFGWK